MTGILSVLSAALPWYAGLLVLALVFQPWTYRVWRHLPGCGPGMLLPGGIFVFVLLQQLVWRAGLGEPHPAWFWLWTGLAGAAGHLLFPAPLFRHAPARREALRNLMVFSAGFWLWTLIRAANPGVTHTEQPMDFMWMQAAMVSASPPIADAWFGGAPATYYVEGHQMLGFLANLFGSPARTAVNLGQITWFALTLQLVYFTAAGFGCGRVRQWPLAGRGLVGILFFFAANPVGAWHALGGGDSGEGWWWWDATRVLSDGETDMITEFPFFSFWLGDNHAHMLGIPILILSLLAGMQFRHAPRLSAASGLSLSLPVIWSWRTNAWQTPAAFAIPCLFLFLRLLDRRPPRKVPPAFFIGLLAPLLLLFPAAGGGMFQGIALNRFGIRNPLSLLLVFGFFVPALLPLCRKKYALSPPFLIVLLGAGMLAVCEIVYARDIYDSRMNTVFKFYYQVWILWTPAAAAGWWVLHHQKALRIPAAVILLFAALGWAYPLRLAGPAIVSHPKSLDAITTMPRPQRPLVETASRVIQPGQLILESPGDSFQAYTSLLGTWTAGNTLIGWRGHQDQWRPGEPHPDPAPVYRARTEAELQEALDLLQPDWVLKGLREQVLYDVHPDWHSWMLRHFDLIHAEPENLLYGNTP